MGHDVCKIETEDGNPTIRVDTWDATGRHWLYYFRKPDSSEKYELFATSEVPYEGDRIGTKFGITAAEQKAKKEGYKVEPFDQ